MNKKLTLKLLLLLLTISLSSSIISCDKKDNTSNVNNETQSSVNKEENKVTTNSDVKEDETQSSIHKEENTPKPDTNTEIKEETNQKPDVKQGLTQEEYYKLIKDAKKRQQDYIDSIEDPNVKQSVQTSYSAAVAESTILYIKYPDDTNTIDAALKRVLSEE